MQDMWGELLTPAAKRAKSGDASDTRAPQQNSNKSGPRQRNNSRGADRSDPLVKQLAKLVLHQEEQLKAIARSSSMVFHFNRSQHGIVPAIIGLCQAWKDQLAKDRSKIREPLRVVTMKAILDMLHNRHQQVVRGEVPLPPLLLDAATKSYQELTWDPNTSQLIPLKDGKKVTLEQLTQWLKEAVPLIVPEALERLKALRPLGGLSSEATLPMLITMSAMSDNGRMLYVHLRSLINCSCWQLLDATMRMERGKPEPLAENIRKIVYPDKSKGSSET